MQKWNIAKNTPCSQRIASGALHKRPLTKVRLASVGREYNEGPRAIWGPFFLRHGGPPPKALHQSGLTMGKMSVHGEPKFSEGQPRVFTNLIRVKTLHELHHGPEKVKILVEAISVKDAKGYIAYTKAK